MYNYLHIFLYHGIESNARVKSEFRKFVSLQIFNDIGDTKKEKSAFSWVWTYVRRYRFGMVAGLCLSVCVAAMNMVNPVVTGRIVDKVIKGGQHELLFKSIAVMLCVVVGKSIFRYTYQVIFEHCSQNVILKMREDLYAHIQKLDFSWYDTAPAGNVMTLLTSDLDKVRHFVAWVLYNSVDSVHQWFDDHKIDYEYITPSDLSQIEGVEFLFSSTWTEFDEAAEEFAKVNEEFADYLPVE